MSMVISILCEDTDTEIFPCYSFSLRLLSTFGILLLLHHTFSIPAAQHVNLINAILSLLHHHFSAIPTQTTHFSCPSTSSLRLMLTKIKCVFVEAFFHRLLDPTSLLHKLGSGLLGLLQTYGKSITVI